MFFDMSLFKLLPPPHTLYKHIVAVKAMIDKQSPHANCCLSRGGGGCFRNGLCLFILISFEIR